MSAVSVAPSTPLPKATSVPFGRLVLVEWRKMTDTRGGFWLLLSTVILLLLFFGGALAIVGFSDFEATAATWSSIFSVPLSLLVPVFAITIVTQEWGQRTAMVTFALEPSRLKVVLAKLVTVVLLGVAVIAAAFALGALGNVIGATLLGTDAVWDLTVKDAAWSLAFQILYLLMGFGFGLVFLSTPAAVALYYIYNQILSRSIIGISVVTGLYVAFDWAKDILPWIDIQLAMLPFVSADTITELTGTQVDIGAVDYGRLVTSIGLWVVLPIGLGIWRLLRAEVK